MSDDEYWGVPSIEDELLERFEEAGSEELYLREMDQPNLDPDNLPNKAVIDEAVNEAMAGGWDRTRNRTAHPRREKGPEVAF